MKFVFILNVSYTSYIFIYLLVGAVGLSQNYASDKSSSMPGRNENLWLANFQDPGGDD